MPKKKTASTVISFPVPRSGTGSDTDPLWPRIEALCRGQSRRPPAVGDLGHQLQMLAIINPDGLSLIQSIVDGMLKGAR